MMNLDLPIAVPDIPVANLAESLDYYQSRLAFSIDYKYGSGAALISNGKAVLRLVSTLELNKCVAITLLLDSKKKLEELHKFWQGNRAKVISPLKTAGVITNFSICDIDNNIISVLFLERPKTSKNFLTDLALQSRNAFKAKKIDVTKSISVDQFRERYGKKGIPCVIRSTDVPNWGWDSIGRDFGHIYLKTRNGHHGGSSNQKIMRIDEYLGLISGEEQENYMASNLLPNVMSRDLQLPKYSSDDYTMERAYLWIGGAGTGAELHRDLQDNFVLQVLGRKEFVLAPPHEAENLYEREVYSNIIASKCNFYSPDYDSFPLSKNVDFHTVILERGDLLYIPCGWWHQTKNSEENCSVNFFSKASVQALPDYEASLRNKYVVI